MGTFAAKHSDDLHAPTLYADHFPSKKAEATALGALEPLAAHLVHMPSHIYLRLGRYHESVIANQRGRADEDYIAQCNAQGFYPAAYNPQTLHFLWHEAMMEGQRGPALATAAINGGPFAGARSG